MSSISPAVVVKASSEVNLSKSWDSFFSAIEGQAGPLLNLAALFGMVLVVAAVVTWAWQRRRQGGAGNSGMIWGALLVGALCAAPKAIIPIFLFVFDMIANAVVDVVQNEGVKGG